MKTKIVRTVPMIDYQKKCQMTESLQWQDPDRGLLHAALGLMTETVELLNFQNEKNFLEELGDITWYVAIGAAHLDLTMDDLDDMNVPMGSKNDDAIQAMVEDAAEIVDAFKKSIFYGREMDR